MRRSMSMMVAAALLSGSAAGALGHAEAPSAGPVGVGTIHELMEDIVQPSAYILWDATAVLTDETGVHEQTPKTDADWERLRRAALALTEAPNLVTMAGRKVIPDGETMEAGGTLDAAAIQARLVERRANFLEHAAGLQAVALEALRAVDARDLKALDAAGGTIDAACEACHQEFWYPPEEAAKGGS